MCDLVRVPCPDPDLAWSCLERHGGPFSHHHGGLEDNAPQSDASLAGADLVICQTGSA